MCLRDGPVRLIRGGATHGPVPSVKTEQRRPSSGGQSGFSGEVWLPGADHRPSLGSGRWISLRRDRDARGLRQVDDANVDRTDVRILLVMDKAALAEPQLLSRGFGQEQIGS
jgi:hypothetical protein